MTYTTRQRFTKATLLAMIFALQACAPSNPSSMGSNQVADAFETSGSMNVKPYTRTIFSSNDF